MGLLQNFAPHRGIPIEALRSRPGGPAAPRLLRRTAGAAEVQAALQLGSTGLVSGMSIPELSHHLELARRAAGGADHGPARELEDRAALLRALLARPGSGLLERLCEGDSPREPARFGAWLTRLQAAWYAGRLDCARAAAQAAARLAGPLTEPADLMLYHLFAALLLSCGGEALTALELRHRAGDGALSALARAAFERGRGDVLAALRGFEQAAAGAADRELPWLAALASEQAAQLAADCGLAGAARHYREQAVAANRRWGALGRADALCAAWQAEATPPGAARPFALDDAACFGKALAHELNQPLAAVTLHAAAAARWLRRAQPDLERALDSLELIGAAGRQAGDIVCGMQRLAAGRDNEREAVDIDATVRDTLRALRRLLRRHGIAVELELGLGGLAIGANRVQLQQVLTNLVLNAIEAHAAGPATDRRVRIVSRTCGDAQVELAVSDNGPGIAPADRERLFTSLFSTKPPRKDGAGMGLSICLSIVRAHGGHIWHDACAPQGACFRLRLPLDAVYHSASFNRK